MFYHQIWSKGKVLNKNSSEFRASKLSSQDLKERENVLLKFDTHSDMIFWKERNNVEIILKFLEFILLTKSLLGPSSVWSESNMSRSKNSEFESSTEYSLGPVPDQNRCFLEIFEREEGSITNYHFWDFQKEKTLIKSETSLWCIHKHILHVCAQCPGDYFLSASFQSDTGLGQHIYCAWDESIA